MEKVELNCVRCGRRVESNREQYEAFEKMHWICFHLEYEHEGDPDEACKDLSCPWWHIEVYKRELERLGKDPGLIMESAIAERFQSDKT